MKTKALARISVAAPLAAALLLMPHANAAAPYTFTASAATVTSVTRQAFLQDRCSQRIHDSAVNGSDGRIVPVTQYAGRDIIVTWQATATGGWVTPWFYTNACALTASTRNVRSTAPGQWRLHVPAGSSWFVLDGLGVAQVSFTIAVAP